MRRIKVWFAAFGLAGILSAGAAGQAFAAPAETEAAAVTETAAEPAADAAAGEAEAAASGDNAAETAEAESASPSDAERKPEPSEEALRENIVDYALSFVGGRYVWGGNDPHTGADCSGFVRYILSNTAGVSMSRTSAAQAQEGVTVSAEEMQPGDLLFYGKGSRVNHVAMYIGDGQIVHASTSKTGIKVSQWNYRNPIRIASFIG